MSRGSFRAQVAAPRPPSAWALVTVASATLWITGQLDAWVIGLQALAITGSLLGRTYPFRWQRSPLALNVAMFGIVGVTIAVALRGDPSTIALAHFAALSQGLQLIDSRPRHTEFLLVALALFQVILAANLTDSVFFTPLLIAFVFAAVWTLLVHTLRSEAIEAGDPHAVTRAITPGLVRTTLIASGLSVVLALVIFMALPRLRSSVVTTSIRNLTVPTAGFSDRVALGDLGRIRQDGTVVLRVQTLEPASARQHRDRYWRGLAFDRFDGTSWSITPASRQPVAGSAEGGVTLGHRPDQVNLVQRIVREPVEGGVLFGAGEIRRLQGTVRRLERDSSGGLYAAGQAYERIRYIVSTWAPSWRDADLRGEVSAPPSRHRAERYLQIPEVAPEIGHLVDRILDEAGARTDSARARALETHLLRNGRYTDTPPDVSAAEGSPVEAFLFGELAGHCEYFASSMVLLARHAGLYARLVNGFAGGRRNRIGDFIEVTRSDAHTWVEIHYTDAGWVRYDPTPLDRRSRPAKALSLASRVRELGSALELWWFQRVVGFDRSDQIHAVKRAWLAWTDRNADRRQATTQRREAPAGEARGWRGWRPRLDRRAVLLALGVAASGALAMGLRRRTRHAGVPPSYAAALRMLAYRGLVRAESVTAHDFCREIARTVPAPGAAAFAVLTDAYLAERFGRQPSVLRRDELRTLRLCLRRLRR